MPSPTHVKIETVTVTSGGSASIAFNSIPQTYTDLKLVLSLRNNVANTSSNVLMYFNGAGSGTNFPNMYIQGNGGSVSTGAVNTMIGDLPGTSITSGYFGNIEVYIYDYAQTTFYKHFHSRSAQEANSATAYMMNTVGRWNDSSAITSIRLDNRTSGSFTQYSTATLYGIKNN